MAASTSRAASPGAPVQHYSHRRNLNLAVPARTTLHATPSPSPVALTTALSSSVSPLHMPGSTALSRQSSARSALRSNPSNHGDEAVTEEGASAQGDEPHPLQAEIERLSTLCDQHELKFRSSKASFEHRVFSEFPSILGRFSELDARAEKSTGELYATMHETVPVLEERLDTLVAERAKDVETMRERTTPWVLFAADEDDKGLKRVRSGGRVGRIERVRDRDADNDESEALAMVERWADEVEMHLTDEIVRLKGQLGDEYRKRIIILRLCLLLACLLIAFLLLWWLRKSRIPPFSWL